MSDELDELASNLQAWCTDVMEKLDHMNSLFSWVKHLDKNLNYIDGVQATHIRDHEKLRADLEELFQASVHLHKDVHTLDEKLDRIEALELDTLDHLSKRLDRIEKLLAEGVLVEPLKDAMLIYKKDD